MNNFGNIFKIVSIVPVKTRFLLSWRSATFPVVLLLAALAVFPWDEKIIDYIRCFSISDASHIYYIELFDSYLSGFGKADVLIMFTLLCGFCGMKQRVVALVCAMLLTALFVWPIKIIVHRERPRGNSYVSFPSGDAASIASFSYVVSSVYPIAIPFAAVTVVAVSAARVITLAHHPSDVLVGSALGIFAGMVGLQLSRRYVITLRQRHYFVLLVLLVYGNELLCMFTGSQNTISNFIKLYGFVIGLIIFSRLVYCLFLRRKMF